MTGRGFSGALDLRAYKPDEWVLLEDFRYRSIDGREFTAPRWFVTDLASIPWAVQPLFAREENRPAGVIHDWLYCSQAVPRAEADALFREMVLFLRESSWKAALMYAGLRVGGGSRYAACNGGPKPEDFAWEFMSRLEVDDYQNRLIDSARKTELLANSTPTR